MLSAEQKVYSQGGEQRYILEAVGDEPGFLLDIGAWDPKDKSNSRALIERGWSAVLVEPSPGPFLSLLREYGNDEKIKLIHAAVGLDRHCAEFWATDDAVSTTERKNLEKWRDHAAFIGKFYVPMITLSEIINQFCAEAFSFVNIDTEGTSVDVLHALLETPMFPKCICVEHDERLDEVLSLATDKGYKIVCKTGENLVLVR